MQLHGLSGGLRKASMMCLSWNPQPTESLQYPACLGCNALTVMPVCLMLHSKRSLLWAHNYVLAMLVLAETARHAGALPVQVQLAKHSEFVSALPLMHAVMHVQQAPWHVSSAAELV